MSVTQASLGWAGRKSLARRFAAIGCLWVESVVFRKRFLACARQPLFPHQSGDASPSDLDPFIGQLLSNSGRTVRPTTPAMGRSDMNLESLVLSRTLTLPSATPFVPGRTSHLEGATQKSNGISRLLLINQFINH
jgi:hypothetical protein